MKFSVLHHSSHQWFVITPRLELPVQLRVFEKDIFESTYDERAINMIATAWGSAAAGVRKVQSLAKKAGAQAKARLGRG